MSLVDNRLGKLIPNTNSVEIGTPTKPIHKFYTHHIDAVGTIKADKFEGKGINNLDIGKLIMDQQQSGKGIGGSNRPFTNLYVKETVSSMHMNADFFQGGFSGNGNDVVFDNLKSDIIPHGNNCKIGTAEKMYNEMHSEKIFARTVQADNLVGDGTGITGVKCENFTSVNSAIIPTSNQEFDIGEEEKRFNTLYVENVSANDRMMGRKLIVTNNSIPIDISHTREPLDLSWFDQSAISTEIMSKFGSQIHATLENVICGVSLFNEVITSDLMVRNIVFPEIDERQSIGTSNNRFSDLYVKNAHVHGNLISKDTASLHDVNIDGDVNAIAINCSDVYADHLHGNGQFLKNLNNLGPLLEDLNPDLPNVINLGSIEKPYNSMHAHTMYCQKLSLGGQQGTAVPQILQAIPEECEFKEFDLLRFKGGTLLSKFEYDAKTNMFTSPGVGICVIGFNVWDTNYKTDDPNVKWVIEHKKYIGGKYTYYNLEGYDTCTLVINKGDKFQIAINPQFRVKTLKILPQSVMVVQSTLIDEFIAN